MYHIGSYHVKYFTTKNIIIQVTIIPPKTIHLSYRERERKKVTVVDSSLVHYRIIAKIFNDEGEGGVAAAWLWNSAHIGCSDQNHCSTLCIKEGGVWRDVGGS